MVSGIVKEHCRLQRILFLDEPAPNDLHRPDPALGNTSDNGLKRGLDEAEARRISPALLDIKTLPPTLVMVGTKDRFHPQIRSFVDKSVAAGAKVELFEAEGQPHGFFNKAPWLEKTTAQADAFLVRLGYLEKPPEPAAAPSGDKP